MNRPKRIILQWHITDQCNLRCSHCYQQGYQSSNPSLEELLIILEQFKKFLAYRRRLSRVPIHAQITVTGGEPFLRGDFFDLLEIFKQNRNLFSFAILTNGSLLTSEATRRLRRLGPAFVQVSLEGGPATHDQIRGPHAHQRTMRALALLARHKIPSLVSFTAQRDNMREFDQVVQAARAQRATRVWADRLIPAGSGAALAASVLTPEQTIEFFHLMRAAQKQAGKWWRFQRSEVSMNRALQFLVAGGEPYFCKAGHGLLTVLPNGDLLPCRRMPIVAGNLHKKPLIELYNDSNLLALLRDRERIPAGCETCSHVHACRGGLRCLSFALYNDPFRADPGCPLARNPGKSGNPGKSAAVDIPPLGPGQNQP